MSVESILTDLKKAYISNFPNQIREIENLILALERGTDFKESFESLYRRVHSIKGSSGTFGFSIIGSICHQMEDFISTEITAQSCKDTKVCNILFEYLDLMMETRDALVAANLEIPKIEKKLNDINKKAHHSKKKCLCVGMTEGVHYRIIQEAAKRLNIQCAFASSGLIALERLLHEHFDILITPRENVDINGTAIIAAVRLNKLKNVSIKSILLTSNTSLDIPPSLAPHFVIAKDKNFSTTLLEILDKIKHSS